MLHIAFDADPVALHDLGALAHRNGLTAYDAAYLELAKRLGTSLASQDEALRKAAIKAGVKLYE